MAQNRNNDTETDNRIAVPKGSSQPPSEHPLFKGLPAFEAMMLRVAIQDLHEDGSGCTPFIATTAALDPDVRQDLLIRASAALLGHCDRYGAAECMKFALGREHEEPSDELGQAIDDGLEAIAEAADLDSEGDDDEEDPWSMEDLVQLIDEVHKTPSA